MLHHILHRQRKYGCSGSPKVYSPPYKLSREVLPTAFTTMYMPFEVSKLMCKSFSIRNFAYHITPIQCS